MRQRRGRQREIAAWLWHELGKLFRLSLRLSPELWLCKQQLNDHCGKAHTDKHTHTHTWHTNAARQRCHLIFEVVPRRQAMAANVASSNCLLRFVAYYEIMQNRKVMYAQCHAGATMKWARDWQWECEWVWQWESVSYSSATRALAATCQKQFMQSCKSANWSKGGGGRSRWSRRTAAAETM